MSIAGSFSYSQPRIVLRNRRPRLSARVRAEKIICRIVMAALIVSAGAFAAPIFFGQPETMQMSAQAAVDTSETTAATAVGSPVRIIPIYHVEADPL